MTYRVVIIDDEPWTRDVIKRLADWKGLKMSVAGEASDGFCGLELIKQIKPHIVISDVKMPGMNGLELLAQLKELGINVKTIVISGFDDFAFVQNALRLQVVDYLLKPIKPVELNEQLLRCKEQLDSELQRKQQDMYDAGAFLAVDWFGHYTNARQQLSTCLRGLSKDLVRKNMQSLLDTVTEQQKEDINIQELIYIYYDLMQLLEQFIVENSYTVRQIFEKQDISFVFHQGVALKTMLEFVETLYCKAVEVLGKLKKMRNKADVGQIKEYIDANYAKGISLEQVAGMFFLSKEYLSRIFKQYTGHSFSDYVTEKRMERARALICEYKIPIKEVVGMVGYSDQAHFYKVFKKYFGVTPGEIKEGRL